MSTFWFVLIVVFGVAFIFIVVSPFLRAGGEYFRPNLDVPEDHEMDIPTFKYKSPDRDF